MLEQDKLHLMNVHQYMTEMHFGQFRKKSDLPYAVHPVQVMCLLSEWGIEDPLTLGGGLAHDILEDRPDVTASMMAERIGLPTTNLVEELSFFPDDGEGAFSIPDQKMLYISSFRSKSIRSVVIKDADRICNTRDFLITDPRYAPKYLAKAADLFVIFNERVKEIEELFGPKVVASMEYSIHEIHAHCAQISSSNT